MPERCKYTDTLLKVDHVSLSYGDKIILATSTRRCATSCEPISPIAINDAIQPVFQLAKHNLNLMRGAIVHKWNGCATGKALAIHGD